MDLPLYSNLPINYHPQKNEFNFFEDELIFNSKFDSGNLLKVERINSIEVKC